MFFDYKFKIILNVWSRIRILGKRSQKGSGILTDLLAKILVGAGKVVGV